MNFLNVLIENFEAAKKGEEEDFAGTTKKEAVLETYEDLISIYTKHGEMEPNTYVVSEDVYKWLMLNRPMTL